MSEYLNVAGIISFDEFVHALDKGQLSQQLNAIQREYFHDQQFRNLILESVRVDQEQNGLRIVPSFRKCIKSCPTDECQLETEAASYVKTPPVPARSTSLHRRLKHSVEHIHRGTNVSEKIHQYHQQYIKKDCVLHYLKTKPSQKQYVQRSCGKQLVPQRQRKSKTDSKSDNEMSNRNVIKSLAGNVERKKERLQNIVRKSDAGNRSKQVNNIPHFSAGYQWHRDFNSTDDESIWDRIGSVFSERRWSSSNKSVSSGDYCVHGVE